MLVEKVGDFAVLVVTFGRHKDAMHRLRRQILTNLGNWKHDLLHGAVTAYNLDLSSMLRVIFKSWVCVQLTMHV